jgi:hypothetical protein
MFSTYDARGVRFSITTFLLLLHLHAAALATTESQQPAKGAGPGRANQSAPQPPINVTPTSPVPGAEENQRDEARQERNLAAQEDIRDFTRVLTIATVIQAVIGFFALLATFRAANAAKRSAEGAEQAVRLTQRANFAVGGWNIDGVANGQSPTRVAFRAVNIGHVTGTLIERYCMKAICDTLADTPIYRAARAERCSIPVAPRQALRQSFEIAPPVTADELAEIVRGDGRHLWLYGYFKYTDGFNQTRTIGFCVRYQEGELRVAGPSTYNYAD